MKRKGIGEHDKNIWVSEPRLMDSYWCLVVVQVVGVQGLLISRSWRPHFYQWDLRRKWSCLGEIVDNNMMVTVKKRYLPTSEGHYLDIIKACFRITGNWCLAWISVLTWPWPTKAKLELSGDPIVLELYGKWMTYSQKSTPGWRLHGLRSTLSRSLWTYFLSWKLLVCLMKLQG